MDSSTRKSMGRIIRKPEVLHKVGFSDTKLWRMEKAGEFPRRVALGGNSSGWFEMEVDEWMAQRAAERLNPDAPRCRHPRRVAGNQK
ncbi:MAG: AlpA family transcriptional regulator [Desulfobacteraceae bacterium]|nr:AlpA family transcriptional regulator [Desulfobacteraceae bacterium]